jgi:hypothetical protein
LWFWFGDGCGYCQSEVRQYSQKSEESHSKERESAVKAVKSEKEGTPMNDLKRAHYQSETSMNQPGKRMSMKQRSNQTARTLDLASSCIMNPSREPSHKTLISVIPNEPHVRPSQPRIHAE